MPHRFTNRSVIVGESVDLTCISVGIPVPTVTWLFRRQQLTSDHIHETVEDFQMINSSTYHPGTIRSTLRIVNAQNSDEGVYECINSNTFSETSIVFHLLVIGNTITWE